MIGPTILFSQVTGTVIDDKSNEPVIGAKVIASNGSKALSDIEGKFSLKTSESDFPLQVIVTQYGYRPDTILVENNGDISIRISPPVQQIESVVVSAGRRSQEIEEVPISMEIIRPDLIDNKGITDLEQAVDQCPGVYAMDGQVSIRGGSGFAYGAGSRVMLLWNGMPLISGEAGDTKWNSIPMEAASQIEVIKGASSVLYGSGALNGIISLVEREPGLDGEFRFKSQFGVYGKPNRPGLQYWTINPTFHQTDFYYGKMYKKFGFTVSANNFESDGFRQGESEDRTRVSGTFYIRPQRVKRLKAGIGYNVQYQETGNFIIWESDSAGYSPSGGADPSVPGSTLSNYKGIRASIDPYVKYIDRYNNVHNIKTRYYLTSNTNLFNELQNSIGKVTYADYQFQRKAKRGYVLTTGVTGIYNGVEATLFGNHSSINTALYFQYEQELFNRLNLAAGVRMEYFEQDGKSGDTDFFLRKTDTTAIMPVYPVFRAAANYRIAKFTFIRASFGQGIRYPSVAERYTKTSVGALNIFPNENLRPEKGWAAELGIKQAVKIGEGWKGLIDVAGFINTYSNMMEFAFGVYVPEGTIVSFNDTDPNFIGNFIGFQAQNAEEAKITGIEFSFNSTGKIGEVELTTLMGYTYMNPITQNDDWQYLQYFSSFNDSIIEYTDPSTGKKVKDTVSRSYDPTLKYRFRHMVKADVEATWKNLSLGFSARYNSAMVNIDGVFEDDLVPPTGLYILPGLKSYREKFDGSAMVFDTRIGYLIKEHYRVGFMINNLLNAEYTSRPGDIQPQRTFIVQLQAKF